MSKTETLPELWAVRNYYPRSEPHNPWGWFLSEIREDGVTKVPDAERALCWSSKEEANQYVEIGFTRAYRLTNDEARNRNK